MYAFIFLHSLYHGHKCIISSVAMKRILLYCQEEHEVINTIMYSPIQLKYLTMIIEEKTPSYLHKEPTTGYNTNEFSISEYIVVV